MTDGAHPTDVPGRFAGKRLVLSGGGRGIGEATARRAAREGADVLLISRTQAEIEAVAGSIVMRGGKAWWHVADVAVAEQVDAAVAAARERWGGIDVLDQLRRIRLHVRRSSTFPITSGARLWASTSTARS